MIENNYEILLKKLDAFIKKYYINKIIKGLLLAATVYLLWYFIIVIAEYFGHFSVGLRTSLVVITAVLYLMIFVTMILIPILNLFKIGKTIDYQQASKILGQYFPEIADKLQNTLELKQLIEKNHISKDIIIASINQRTQKLSPIPFLTAINLKKNFRYFKLLAPILIALILLFVVWPGMFSDATERIINFNTHYTQPDPFSFKLLNDSLIAKKGTDFIVEVSAKGDYSPDQVVISYGSNDFYMEKKSAGVFQYKFINLNNSIRFNMSAAGISSEHYKIEVLPAPSILDFEIFVDAPNYTGVEDRKYQNSGDLNVPVGSKVFWTFNTLNLDKLNVVFDSISIEAVQNLKKFQVERVILKPCTYTVNLENQYFKDKSGINYQISVIPDLYPTISVKNITDTTHFALVYYNGFIDDDYGFTDLKFVCKPKENNDTLIKISIPFSKRISSQDFYFAFDFSSLDTDGTRILYYFEVSDNDGVNGVKTTRTREMEFIIPGADDLQDMSSKTNKDTEEKIDKAKDVSLRIRKNVEELQKKLIDEKMTAYERNQMMEQIMQDQAKLDQLMSEISQEQSKMQQFKEQFSKNEEMLQKQNQINELMKNLMDEEMRKLMEELQKLMEDFDKEDFFKIADDLKYSAEEMEKQMDNTLELLKKAEIEERLNKSIDDLEELAKEHKELSENTENKDLSQEKLQEKQEEHIKEFEDIKKEYQETLEKNAELQEPMQMDDFDEEMQEISEMMEQAQQEMQDNKNRKAAKSQKQASEGMKKMSEQMQAMMDAQSMEQMMENLEDIRQVLANLLTFSFDQEEILIEQKTLGLRDPRFKKYTIQQKNAQNNFDIIRDSLNAMSSRIPELGPLVSKEIADIYRNLNVIMSEIGENRRYKVEASQQLVMTSANNLALLLVEMLEQMQQDMAMQKSGEGQCNNCKKPGEGKPKGQMRDMQKGMKQQMQDMIDMMKEGGKKPGGRNSEQLAKMLMQQEMMQQMLNDMMNGGISPESAKLLQEINRMMDENLSDIIDGNITPQTINRQENILTRLLQAENSERERDVDDKRKSNEARDYKLSNPDAAFKEKEAEIRFNELLQMSNVKLRSYYKAKYKEYLKTLGNN
ncbi:MAG: hypothetical protein PHW82_06810 [Bacteroidales bacterium]|nr:hypothetical protein [Bacteroidales bacterium]